MAPSHPSGNPKLILLLAALVAATASIPLPVNLNSIAVIFLVLACAIQQPWSGLKKKLAEPALWIVPVVYFIWLCCSFFWDETNAQVKDIERYAVLLFIPPALAVVPRISQQYLRITAAVFILMTIGICLGCLVKSYEEYQISQDNRVFFYHYLSQQMNLNAIFLSNYCLSGITWLLYDGFVIRRVRKVWYYPVIIIAGVFLFCMILLLSSKLIIFLTIALLTIFMLYIGFINKHFLRALVIIILFATAGAVGVTRLGFVRWRILETSTKKYSGPEDNNNGLSIRILMWRTAWDLIKERPLLGYGVKGARIRVVEKYRQEKFVLGYTEGYHSHNQYLQSALAGGIPALILLLVMLLKMAWEGWKRDNILLLLLLLHFMIQSIIESTFEVQQELVFYILFLFLFYYHPPQPRAVQAQQT